MIKSRNILFLFISAIYLSNSNADTCINNDPCLCQINENDKIDISEISNEIKPPDYLSSTINKVTYTFVGCRDNTYNNVLGSLIITSETNNTKLVSKSIGNASNIKFSKEDSNYLITYINGKVHPVIVLLCDQYKIPFLKVINNSSTDPKLLLSSPTLCIKTEHHGMSGGSTFLLILFIGLVIYFVGGALVLYFIRGARGAELIPNVDFWTNLPGLVKDGLIFLLSGCKPNFVTTAESYDRI
ncbi:cation-dependent mannose-6-phosphate receptor-like [Diorhabda carinulata]|uniref:cation-dependent mannose-6-phosphate receptor-like n=1 Tax=Diorhabda carinulata TaxID=1163345 RepID=UPI0025A0638B|nr:cation-dependent mannose-6-phosphate receptor-like [Diorhabda carinulata]